MRWISLLTACVEAVVEVIGTVPRKVYQGTDLSCVFDGEDAVRTLQPDLEKVKALDGLLLHAAARDSEIDCVSRIFAPKCKPAHKDKPSLWAGPFAFYSWKSLKLKQTELVRLVSPAGSCDDMPHGVQQSPAFAPFLKNLP